MDDIVRPGSTHPVVEVERDVAVEERVSFMILIPIAFLM